MIWQQQNQRERNQQVQAQVSPEAERLRSKSLYKLFLVILKYTPITLALIDIIHTTLTYFEINTYFLNYLGGVSVIFLGLLFILSYLFRFCYLYRFPLYYILSTNLIALVDTHVGIPISDINMYRTYWIIFGIMMVVFIYKSVKNNDKHHKKSIVSVY